MASTYVFDLNRKRLPESIGNKATKLHWLAKKGFITPATHVCTWKAHAAYLNDHVEIVTRIKTELQQKLDPGQPYAIRSSANIEDSLEHSFAGQFKTVLNVQGIDPILQALWAIWATSHTPGVSTYLKKNAIAADKLRMAAIIQAMIHPISAGVAFSQNPVTGLDETIVEAVIGSGAALVQDGITPHRWVHKWGSWLEKSGTTDIDAQLVKEIISQTQAIAKAYGSPVDLEWVYDGKHLYWIQLREITTKGSDLYSNRIAKEMFPGMIKPLIWSINVPLMSEVKIRLLTEMIGPNELNAQDLVKPFYYRAYFNMSTLGTIFEHLGLPKEMLEIMAGVEAPGTEKPSLHPTVKTYTLLPRIIRTIIGKLLFERKIKAFLPAMRAHYKALQNLEITTLPEEELLDKIQHLYTLTQKTAYYNTVILILMHGYNAMLKRQLQRLGIDFEEFDLMKDVAELQRFDPTIHLRALNRQYQTLDQKLRTRIQRGTYENLCEIPETEKFKENLEHFIEQFGHLSDSGNDFSSTPWREDPDTILKMITDNTIAGEKQSNKVSFDDLDVGLVRKRWLSWSYNRARRFVLYREAISALYTFGYGLFRIYFLALGRHFLQRGILAAEEDIFYLPFETICKITTNKAALHTYQDTILEIKDEMRKYKAVRLPAIIYDGQELSVETQEGCTLRGTPTARGRYTGAVKVVRGIRDFNKVKKGDVLVIPYSDVGWTPLFAKVGAIIAESGGILSHSSIVAREYNIPAVVSVSGACELEDGTLVTVDGYQGHITLQKEAS